jgi:hypothetical protein
MQKKYAGDGLVIVSVTLDESTDEKDRAEYRKKTDDFLAGKKLPFPTYDLDFDRDRPPGALTFAPGSPRVFVFNRDNQHVLREQGPEHEKLDKIVAEVVKKK